MGFWWRICWDIESGCKVTVYKWEFSGLKIPYDTVSGSQILPILNTQHRQNPVAGHTCVNSNMQSTKFLLSLLTGYKISVYNRANYIFGKTVEKLRRKAIGPVKMAASCINTITEYVIVVWLWRNSCFFIRNLSKLELCKDGIFMFRNRSWRLFNCVYFVCLSTGIGKTW